MHQPSGFLLRRRGIQSAREHARRRGIEMPQDEAVAADIPLRCESDAAVHVADALHRGIVIFVNASGKKLEPMVALGLAGTVHGGTALKHVRKILMALHVLIERGKYLRQFKPQ